MCTIQDEKWIQLRYKPIRYDLQLGLHFVRQKYNIRCLYYRLEAKLKVTQLRYTGDSFVFIQLVGQITVPRC